MNDLIANHAEEIAIATSNEQQQGMQLNEQQQGMQVDLNLLAKEKNLLQLADQDMQHIQIVNVNVWPDEIDPDELMNEDDMHEEDGNNDGAINIDDINLDELAGPGEAGFVDE